MGRVMTEHRDTSGVAETVRLTPAEEAARKRRNLYIAGAIVGFMAIVFLITLVRLQEYSLARPF